MWERLGNWEEVTKQQNQPNTIRPMAPIICFGICDQELRVINPDCLVLGTVNDINVPVCSLILLQFRTDSSRASCNVYRATAWRRNPQSTRSRSQTNWTSSSRCVLYNEGSLSLPPSAGGGSGGGGRGSPEPGLASCTALYPRTKIDLPTGTNVLHHCGWDTST